MSAQFRHPGFRPRLHVQIRPPSTERYRVRFRCEPSTIRGVRADASRKFAEWGLAEGGQRAFAPPRSAGHGRRSVRRGS